jgi:hypothetical protein
MNTYSKDAARLMTRFTAWFNHADAKKIRPFTRVAELRGLGFMTSDKYFFVTEEGCFESPRQYTWPATGESVEFRSFGPACLYSPDRFVGSWKRCETVPAAAEYCGTYNKPRA